MYRPISFELHKKYEKMSKELEKGRGGMGTLPGSYGHPGVVWAHIFRFNFELFLLPGSFLIGVHRTFGSPEPRGSTEPPPRFGRTTEPFIKSKLIKLA